MANSYTGYSFTVPAPGRAEELADKFVEHADWEPEKEGDTHPLGIELDDYQFASYAGVVEADDADTIAIYHDSGGGDLHVAAAVAQWLLRETSSDEEVAFSWAGWCSRPREDKFVGGYVVVTADGFEAWDGYTLHDLLTKAQRPEPTVTFGPNVNPGDTLAGGIGQGWMVSVTVTPEFAAQQGLPQRFDCLTDGFGNGGMSWKQPDTSLYDLSDGTEMPACPEGASPISFLDIVDLRVL